MILPPDDEIVTQLCMLPVAGRMPPKEYVLYICISLMILVVIAVIVCTYKTRSKLFILLKKCLPEQRLFIFLSAFLFFISILLLLYDELNEDTRWFNTYLFEENHIQQPTNYFVKLKEKTPNNIGYDEYCNVEFFYNIDCRNNEDGTIEEKKSDEILKKEIFEKITNARDFQFLNHNQQIEQISKLRNKSVDKKIKAPKLIESKCVVARWDKKFTIFDRWIRRYVFLMPSKLILITLLLSGFFGFLAMISRLMRLFLKYIKNG